MVRHGLKSSQNAVNLKKPQIALLQNVELKEKFFVHALETTVCHNAKHGEWILRHGLKSSQNVVNLKKTQIGLLQNVELKVKVLVHAFETTVRSITVRVSFFGGGAKWEMARR